MTTDTLALTDFLLARIAEDEAVLKAASPGLDFNWGDYGISPELLADAEFFNRFADRPRVLAECEAKRRIVELRQVIDQEIRRIGLDDYERATDMRATRIGLDMAIKALALPHASHPDYREKWRP